MPTKPRFWYLLPLAVTAIFIIGMTIALAGVTVHDTWSTTGIFVAEPVHTQYAQYLGYVRDEANPSRPHMITNGVAFHKYDDEHLDYEFTFVPPFSIRDHQLVTAHSISFDTKVGRYYTLSVVYPVGPIVKNSFRFSPIDQSADTIIYNFDGLLIPDGWHSITVYKDNEVSPFIDGYWSYHNYNSQPVTVLMNEEKYSTKYGFGGVCTGYNPETNIINMDVCPYVYQEFERSYGDFWLYTPNSDEADIIVSP